MPNKTEIESSAKAIAEALVKLSKEEDEAKEKGEKLKKTLEGIGDTAKELAEAMGIAFDAKSLIEFGKQAVETAEDFEGLTENIKSLAANSLAGSSHIGYLNDAIGRLHLPMKEAYQGFEAMERGMALAGITGKNMQQVFEGIAEAGAAMGLKPDEFKKMSDAVAAIGQSSKLSSNSLKDLLQVMPQAAQLAAESMHMGQGQLRQALEKGSIGSSIFLQNFAGQLKQHFEGGLAEAADGVAAKMNDVQTHFTQLMIEIGEDVKPMFISLLQAALPVIDVLKSMFGWMGQHEATVTNVARALTGLAVVTSLYNIKAGIGNKLTEAGNALKVRQAAAFYEMKAAKFEEAAATQKLTAADIEEAAAAGEMTMAQAALNAAMDAFPGMIIVTALSLIAGWAINALGNMQEISDIAKNSFEHLHEKGKILDDFKANAFAVGEAVRANLTLEINDLTGLKAKYEDVHASVDDRNKALADGLTLQNKIYEEEGLTLDITEKHKINIDKATAGMNDLATAATNVAMQMALANEKTKLLQDYLDKVKDNALAKQDVTDILSGDGGKDEKIQKIQKRLGMAPSPANDQAILSNFFSEKSQQIGADLAGKAYYSYSYAPVTGDALTKAFDDQIKNINSTNFATTQSGLAAVEKAATDAVKDNQQYTIAQQQAAKKQASGYGGEGNVSYAANTGINTNNSTGLTNVITPKETSGATGSKSTTINIHIDKQIDKVEIHSTTIEGSTQKIKEALTRALAAAINDSQRLAHD